MTPARGNSGQAARSVQWRRRGALRCHWTLPFCRSLPTLRALISTGCAVNGAPTWAAKRLPISPLALMKVLAYRLQSDAFGDLDKSIRRILRAGKENGVGSPFERRAPRTREGVGLKAGALLVREWNGRLERVMILEEGFAWNGQTFGGLSQIAKAMTGTNWNGHRFFGLRREKLPYQTWARIAERPEIGPPPIERMAHRVERRH